MIFFLRFGYFALLFLLTFLSFSPFNKVLSAHLPVALIPFFAEGAEEGFVADDGTEGFEGTDIAFGVEP